MNASEFVPSIASPEFMKASSSEFVPGQVMENIHPAQQMVLTLQAMGLEVTLDPEVGSIHIPKFENCDCCRGLINMCPGEHCANMGFCTCVALEMQEEEDIM